MLDLTSSGAQSRTSGEGLSRSPAIATESEAAVCSLNGRFPDTKWNKLTASDQTSDWKETSFALQKFSGEEYAGVLQSKSQCYKFWMT